MKIAQYKCSLLGNSLDTLGAEIEVLEVLAAGAPYDHDVLIWNNCESFTEEELSFFPSLKILINWGTDDDNLDQALLAKRGVTVKKVDYYATETLAEYILSLMLIFERKHTHLLEGQKVQGGELYGKKVGIIGMGKIGFRAATMLRAAFKCEILYYAEADKQLPGYAYASVETLFAVCDYVLISTKSGEFSISIATLATINPELVVVNIARDSVLPLHELLPLIRAGRLRGFVGDLDLDAAAYGDLPENVLLFPHRGYMTREAARAKLDILLFYAATVLDHPWHLYIVRHGETEWNKRGVLQGSKDSPLSSAGWQHAQDMALRLKDRGVTKIYSSPLGRARQTADIIAKKIGGEVIEVPAFAEMSFGIFEGKQKVAVEELFSEFFVARKQNELYKLFIPYPEGESYYDVFIRILQPLLNILAQHQSCVIVGHESVNRMLRGLASEKQLGKMVHARQKNNEIIQLDMSAGKEKIIVA